MDCLKSGRVVGLGVCLGAFLLGGSALAQTPAPTPTPAPASTPAPSESAKQDLPGGEEILERFIQATGGREAYLKLKNRVTEGAIDLPAMNVKGKSVQMQAEPNKMTMKAEFPGFGTQATGTDGETVWETNSMMGPRILEGEERATSLRLSTFNSELQWKKLYSKVDVKGIKDVGGKPAYEVELTGTDGQKTTNFYDKDSGLVVKVLTLMKNQMGDIPVESRMEDYRDVDGIKIPFKLSNTVNGNEFVITLDSVKHNVDLPADAFALPEDVKMLKEGGAAKPAEATPPGSEPGMPK